MAAFCFTATSCKKCYDCVTTESISYDDQDIDDFLGYEQEYTREQCDKKKDIEEFEKANTASITTVDPFWGGYTSSATTVCTKQ